MMTDLVFDMGNVLLKYDPDAMLSAFGLNEEERKICIKHVFLSPEWQACDRGDGYREEILKPLTDSLPDKLKKACEDLLFRKDLELSFMPPVEGMEDLLKDLKKSGYRLYVLSNVGLWFDYLAENNPVFSLFDGLFASSRYHLLKPDVQIFSTFCETFGLDPENCLFIDDSVLNCRGAHEAGMLPMQFNGLTESVRSLRERLTYIGIKVPKEPAAEQ